MTRTLVVGAGPVGLTAALELSRRGQDVRIIDKAAGPPAESRAIGINPRTLDILEACGASERILAEGLRIKRARLISPTGTLGVIDFSRLRHRHPFMTALPQRRTQEILEALLAERDVRVERGVTFEGFVRRDREIVCRLSGGGGQDVRVDRLLGCDGAHSTVRTAAGIAFEGSDYDRDWTLADVEMDWPFQADEAVFLFTAQGALFAIPFAPGVWRLVRNGPEPQALLPPEVSVARVVWSSSFRISHRLAERFAVDGLYLAGDSAHIHSPAGARGMNGGIEDAATFAWLAESGREARYDGMRRPAARRVLRQVDRQTRQADIRGGGFTLPLREAMARALLPLGPVQRFAARFITALDQPTPAWLRDR